LLVANEAKIFDQKYIKVGNKIEFNKRNQIYNGEVLKVENSKITIKNFAKDKIEKISNKNFIKNITYEKSFSVNKQQLTNNFTYSLLNLKKNELYKLNCDYENLKKIVDLLI